MTHHDFLHFHELFAFYYVVFDGDYRTVIREFLSNFSYFWKFFGVVDAKLRLL